MEEAYVQQRLMMKIMTTKFLTISKVCKKLTFFQLPIFDSKIIQKLSTKHNFIHYRNTQASNFLFLLFYKICPHFTYNVEGTSIETLLIFLGVARDRCVQWRSG